MMKIMLFSKQTWFMSCVRLIFSFARWKILKSSGRERVTRKYVEGKQINLKGNVFVKKFPWNRSLLRTKQHQREKNIKSHCRSFMMAERKSAVENNSRIQSLQRVCDDKLNLFNFLWFHSRVVVWVRETCVNIIFACLQGWGGERRLLACAKTFSASHPQPRRAKISQ